MVYELTAVILNQIVSGRKSVLEAYGEIVFKAWRAATGACLERIETHLIQNVSSELSPDHQDTKCKPGSTFQACCSTCTTVPVVPINAMPCNAMLKLERTLSLSCTAATLSARARQRSLAKRMTLHPSTGL